MGVREEREWGVRGMWGERDVGCERGVRERVDVSGERVEREMDVRGGDSGV